MCLHTHWYFRRNDYSNLSFFLVIMREDDNTHDSMECVLKWRWLGGQSHCYTFGVWRCLVRWGGFYFFDNSWKKPIMRLIFVTFIQCEEVWGRGRGLNSMTRSFPTLRLDSSLFMFCCFSWCIFRPFIQFFLLESLTCYYSFFFWSVSRHS